MNIKQSKSLIKFVKDRPGYDFRYPLDAKKIKELGWEPTLKFKDALTYTVKWYLENKWFWGK